MIDSRNSSVRENPSHTAGLDSNSCGYRPAMERNFFASKQYSLLACGGILLTSIELYSLSQRLTCCSGDCRIASCCRFVKRWSQAKSDGERSRGRSDILARWEGKGANDRRYQVVLAENEKTVIFDSLSVSNLTGAWYGPKSDTDRLRRWCVTQ